MVKISIKNITNCIDYNLDSNKIETNPFITSISEKTKTDSSFNKFLNLSLKYSILIFEKVQDEIWTIKDKKNIQSILFLWEAQAVMPKNWDPSLHNKFKTIMTWNDDYVDNIKYSVSIFLLVIFLIKNIIPKKSSTIVELFFWNYASFFIFVSLIIYNGLLRAFSLNLEIYSPIIPIDINCIPPKNNTLMIVDVQPST